MLTQYLHSHFAPAFFFLSRERREALKCLYELCRVLDDAVDLPRENPGEYLAAWRQALESSNVDVLRPFGQEKLADKFLAESKKYDIPLFSILDLIDKGVGVDLHQNRFQTPMDTESYCYGVAGTVGIACLPVFGVPWEQAKNFAVRLGIAIQWTNIIRDVGVDAKMGRIYLPLDHLEKFECTEKDFLAQSPKKGFLELMTYEGVVARSHYKRAEELMPLEWKQQLLPARIMGKIYLKLLEKLEAQRYPVFTKRISLNVFEKVGATLSAIKKD